MLASSPQSKTPSQSQPPSQSKSVLYRLGRFAASRPWVVIGTWLALAIIVMVAAGAFGRDLDETFEVPGLDSQQAVELLARAQSDEAGLTVTVVLSPLETEATFFNSPDAAAALTATRQQLLTLEDVIGVSDPAAALATSPDTAIGEGVISADGRIALISMQYPVRELLNEEDLHMLNETLVEARAGSPVQIEAGGDLYAAFSGPETGLGEMIGLVVAVIVLLVAFRSLIAMGLPIGMALFGLFVGVTSLSLVTYLVPIPSWMPQLGAMVGLGVGIDYALFIVTRHREFLAKGVPVAEAAGQSIATAGKAVLFAGGTVVISILGLAMSGVPFVSAAGVGISILVLIMVLTSVTLLPAFLGLSGHWINRIGIPRRATKPDVAAGSPWERWGRHVAANPWRYAIGVTGLLLALSSPVIALELGLPDEGTLPETTTQRRAYDLVADGFGPGTNGPLLVAVDLAGQTGPAATAVVDPLVAAIAADPGVASVARAAIDSDAGVATIFAIPTTSPQDTETVATVARLRSEVLPSVLADNAAVGHVGGQTANVTDVAGRISDRLPYFISAVIVLSFLLLMVLFRSVMVPLKAALLNLLSIGASYGVLVMVFQWGWGKELIGLESTVPIASFIPMFMFAIVFGLSMDYEVFLLSRVREDYLATGDNDGSVIRAIGGTARVITSAALIMVAVFGGFIMGSDPVTKMFGLGMAVAIAVDASIVRMILVPASMKLMGDANWWLPAWLDRLLPAIDLEGGHTAAVAAGPAEAIDVLPQLTPSDRSPVGVGGPGHDLVGAGVGDHESSLAGEV